MALVCAAVVVLPAAASGKEIIDYFGTAEGRGTLGGEFGNATSSNEGAGDSAVNWTGAGAGNLGDIYVIDEANNRLQRFDQDDGGTPANPHDDTYTFVSAWGADVDATPSGGSDYEICTVDDDCKEGVKSGGNGTVAGNGGLARPEGVAIDQDTGAVYVTDDNRRVSVYDGDGTFLRSFGWDVVESGPGDAGGGYEICVAGAICKAGVAGAGTGQLGDAAAVAVSQPDGNPATGTVFVTDRGNERVNTYSLDGSSPSSFGSSAEFDSLRFNEIAVDSRGIVYTADWSNQQEIDRYDTLNANGGGVGFLPSIPALTVTVTGGPGNASGSSPYTVTFKNALGGTDVPELVATNGTTPLSGGSGVTVETTTPGGPGTDEVQKVKVSATAGQFRLSFEGETTGDLAFNANISEVFTALEALSTIPAPPLIPSGNNGSVGLEIDPDSDGAGPDVDVLYVLRTYNDQDGVHTVVQQFGPQDPPGLTAPPMVSNGIHGTVADLPYAHGLGLDITNGKLFVGTFAALGNGTTDENSGVYVLEEAGGTPTGSLDSIDSVTATSANINATVNPNGGPPVTRRLEYSTDGTNWTSTPEVVVGTQETPQSLEIALDPPGTGLRPNTLYHVRLVVTKAFSTRIVTPAQTFTTLTAPPIVETTGAPVRTATTARLEGRVAPRGGSTTYHFEYGTDGPCASNPCQQTSSVPIGSGNLIELVSQRITGLQPGTTYHYRLIADNGNAGSPVSGEGMTVTTRASDAPLSHGPFPGPAGSDRAWEQVNAPETGGNPVIGGQTFSNDGERAVYQIPGGTPQTDSGSAYNQFFAERTTSGWVSTPISPPRDELVGPNFSPSFATTDLSTLFSANFNVTSNERAFWRLNPGGAPTKLIDSGPAEGAGFMAASDDGSRQLVGFEAGLDPAHPTSNKAEQIYDITTGTPKLVSLLPGEIVSPCGAATSLRSEFAFPESAARRTVHWISSDGSLLVFPSQGMVCDSNIQPQLYLRDIPAAETTRISGAPISGRNCGAGLIKQTPDAVFFWTQARLVAEDSLPTSCSGDAGGDIYRYEIESGARECVTCVVDGLNADVVGLAAVSEDGSRVYFRSPKPLVPGAPQSGAYRVEVASGELAFVAPGNGAISDQSHAGNALTPDGTVLIFRSSSTVLNAINGLQNGGLNQYYRYDDRDRSLTCVSCPQDGTVPTEAAGTQLALASFYPEVAPNGDPLNDDGSVFIFRTALPLVGSDQNTPASGNAILGTDVYEWRDGRQMLITDGLTKWPHEDIIPTPNGVSPSGRDVFFTVSAQYTPDALDGYQRLYDARIGGGIVFPPPPRPCPLEVCQGTPKGAPPTPSFGTEAYVGPGNVAPISKRPPCRKGKVRRKGRCVKKKPRNTRRQTNHGRRAHR